jgi:zinc/manganese transport system permease protein
LEDFVRLMAYPFLACLLLAGIHVYLGIHVIARKVIFVDLALAQIAALGGVYGVLLGYDFHDDPWAVKAYSLAFALVGAAVFSFTRTRRERVPHEAIIGITYAVALAATILATSHLPHGSDDVRQLLSGNILWVRADTVLWTAALYATLGILLAASHRKLLRISIDADAAHDEGVQVRLWDFFFYTVFGFVVTSSVAIAGVLLVFSYLVIPAVVAVLFADRVRTRLAIGWACGTLVSFLGVTASYFADLPSGPTIVVTFGIFLVVATLLRYILRAERKGPALARSAGSTALVLAFFGATLLLRKQEHEEPLDMLHSSVVNDRLLVVEMARADDELFAAIRPELSAVLADPNPDIRAAAAELATERDADEAIDAIHGLLLDPDDHARESALRAIRHFRAPSSLEPLLDALDLEEDEYLRIDLAHALLELLDRRGIPPLLELMDHSSIPQVRTEAWEALQLHTEPPVEFASSDAPDSAANDEALGALRAWTATDIEIHTH